MKIWITADTHYGYRAVINKSRRPFKTVEEMDDVLLENLNSKVKENDILYHLGDFCKSDVEYAKQVRARIKCKRVFLVAGNHDIPNFGLSFYHLFSRVENLLEMPLLGRLCVMCHYPMKIWRQCDKAPARAAFHLYGHLHGTMPIKDWSLMLDVGVDAHNFQPWSEEELMDYLTPRLQEYSKQKRNRIDF